jgi:transposase
VEAIHQRVAGMDVHRMEHVVTILVAQEDGTVLNETRTFGGFKRDMRALSDWLRSHRIELVAMESTGIYWKSVFSHLETAGIPALVVNAFHVKNVPGRKTDVSDSQWLAQLARFGLLRGSFIPPQDLRELRLVSRYRPASWCRLWPAKRTASTSFLMTPASSWAVSSPTLMASTRERWSKV